MPIDYGTGQVEPWVVRPDGAVLERLEWSTDVLGSYDGGEQRVRLRGVPRRWIEYDFALSGRERRAVENVLHAWQAQPWIVPVWTDAQPLAAALTAGATTIACDTTTRDFREGGLVGVGTGPLAYELAEIDSIASGALTLAAPLAGNWPAYSTEVWPMRPFTMAAEARLRRFTGADAFGRVQLLCTEACDWPLPSETTYRGLPVLVQAPNWTQDVEAGYLRKLAELDAGTGLIYRDEEGSGAIMMQSHRWLLDGRAQIDDFRRWLYARRGRLSAFWLPSFADDLRIVADVASAATSIDVEHCGYSDNIAQDVGRRDVRIVLLNGTAYHRRITASSEISASVERLVIDTALGADVAASQVAAVHFLNAVRLEADAAEILWHAPDLAECALMTRGSRNDV